MGPIPDDVAAQLAPMPNDFAPAIMQTPHVVAWSGRVSVITPGSHIHIDCEYGLPKSMGHTADELRGYVWQIMELGRIGRADLLGFARVDRHAKTAT